MRNIINAIVVITLSALFFTVVGKTCFAEHPFSDTTSTGFYSSDVTIHDKPEGYVVPIQDPNSLLTQV